MFFVLFVFFFTEQSNTIINTAILANQPVSLPVVVLAVSHDGTVSDVTSAVTCQSTNESTVKVCGFLFFVSQCISVAWPPASPPLCGHKRQSEREKCLSMSGGNKLCLGGFFSFIPEESIARLGNIGNIGNKGFLY